MKWVSNPDIWNMVLELLYAIWYSNPPTSTCYCTCTQTYTWYGKQESEEPV